MHIVMSYVGEYVPCLPSYVIVVLRQRGNGYVKTTVVQHFAMIASATMHGPIPDLSKIQKQKDFIMSKCALDKCTNDALDEHWLPTGVPRVRDTFCSKEHRDRSLSVLVMRRFQEVESRNANVVS
jgi:hypothetical protein